MEAGTLDIQFMEDSSHPCVDELVDREPFDHEVNCHHCFIVIVVVRRSSRWFEDAVERSAAALGCFILDPGNCFVLDFSSGDPIVGQDPPVVRRAQLLCLVLFSESAVGKLVFDLEFLDVGAAGQLGQFFPEVSEFVLPLPALIFVSLQEFSVLLGVLKLCCPLEGNLL